MIDAIFTEQTEQAMSPEFEVFEQAMVGCDIEEGDERFTVYRETLDGTFKKLTQNGKTVQLHKGHNETCLAGPKKYKLESLTAGAPISAWKEE